MSTHSDIPMPTERVAEPFELVYVGPDVADGTIGGRDLVEALTGLTKAFSIVAADADLDESYQLRIKDIDSGSFKLIFQAVEFAKHNPAAASAITAGAAVALNAITNTVSGGYRIIVDIAKLIDAKIKAKGARIAILQASFNEGSVVIQVDGDLILLTKEQYELLLSQRVDKHLSQLVSPLKPDQINQFKIRHADTELVSVDAQQKRYFDFRESVGGELSEGSEISGTLNSLSKTNLRGTFYTSEGIHVPYRYIGGDVQQLLKGFSARENLRVHGRVKYDSDGIPVQIEIQQIEVVQRNIFET